MSALAVGVAGAAGRMGQTLVRLIAASAELRLVAASEARGNAALGRDAGEVAGAGTLGVPIQADVAALFAAAEAVLDFTTPAAALAHTEAAARARRILVLG
ncbi:MAG: 4-hydroxy-tetrahydrodipicolinate reductase, partial [Alphaproteobacteria bacterium]|nr:4-hydroxy-tetrahydrodipicolinate reductase [Alphaproteobacteria bacterium]